MNRTLALRRSPASKMATMLKLACATIGSLLTAVGLAAPPVPNALKAEIAPTGKLRAGINYNNPLLARRDAKTGELSGIAVDLSRELGHRLGLPVKLVPYESAGKMGADAGGGQWDIAYLAIDPARATEIDFTSPYLELEGTYLVPAGSPLQKIEDVDRSGVRLAVTAKSAYDLFLSRQLKYAELARFDTTPQSIDMMVAQKLDAVAAVRTALIAGAARVPGSHVMSGHFMTIPQAAGLPQGRPAAASYVSAFIEEVKASGFVAQALESHGLGPDDALVAPPAAAAAVYVATYLEVVPSAAKQGTALAAQYVQGTRGDPGNLSVVAYQEIGLLQHFVLVESWRDRAAFDEHEKAAHTLRFRDKLAAIQIAPYDQRINHGFSVDPKPATTGPNAVYVVTHVDVPGAMRQQAEALLTTLSEPTRSEPGHVRFDVYQQNDPRTNHFTVFAVWDSRNAFDNNTASAHARQFRTSVGPILGALYDERLYRPLNAR